MILSGANATVTDEVWVVRRKLGVGKYLFSVWNDKGDHQSLIVTKHDIKKAAAVCADKFPTVSLNRFQAIMHIAFEYDASSMANEIPGVHQKVKHPVTGEQCDLFNTIIDLNDSHCWTREKIADWLDTLPNQPKFTIPEGL